MLVAVEVMLETEEEIVEFIEDATVEFMLTKLTSSVEDTVRAMVLQSTLNTFILLQLNGQIHHQ